MQFQPVKCNKPYSYLRYALNYGYRSKVSRDKISGLSVCLQWIDMEKVKIYLLMFYELINSLKT